MKTQDQVLVISLCFPIAFIFIRGFLGCIVQYQLNKSARKKRKQEQKFKEWFIYGRYREEIPRVFIFLYFTILVIHLLSYLFIVVSLFSGFVYSIASTVIASVAIFDGVWITVIFILFGGKEPGFNIGRWISKKKGNKKK